MQDREHRVREEGPQAYHSACQVLPNSKKPHRQPLRENSPTPEAYASDQPKALRGLAQASRNLHPFRNVQEELSPKRWATPSVSCLGPVSRQGKCLYTAQTSVPGPPGAGVKSFPVMMQYFDSILLSSLKPPLIGCAVLPHSKSQ